MRIICIGDSNTYGYDPHSFFGGRYDAAERWVDIAGKNTGHELINCGQNGASIPAGEYSIGTILNWVKSLSPYDKIILMLGSNDLLTGMMPSGIAKRMEKFIAALPIDNKHIILVAPPLMKPGAWVTDPELPERSKILAEEYESLANRLGTGFADSGKWEVDLSYDGVHFTPKGHRSFAAGIENLLEILWRE